jgi:hypothetical protein
MMQNKHQSNNKTNRQFMQAKNAPFPLKVLTKILPHKSEKLCKNNVLLFA